VLVFGVVTQLIAAGMFDVLRRLLAEAAAASQAVESAAVFG
jgi:hypothetical protein